MIRRALLGMSMAVLLAGCAADEEEEPASSAWACQASAQALVRRSFISVAGRMPRGQAEIDVYEDVVRALRKGGLSERDTRQKLVELLARDESYTLRWADVLLDSIQVPRRITSSYFGGLAKDCFGPVGVFEGPAVAEWVRDHGPLDDNTAVANFTVGRLLTSSIRIDDLSPFYRAGLFQLMTQAPPGMNVDAAQLEWTRRKVLGERFQAIYLNRDVTCLKCHNSQDSVTYDADPSLNRAWPLAGYFEEALYGDSQASADPLTYYSLFRHGDVTPAADGPWGWSAKSCSGFRVPNTDDPLGYEIAFGSIKTTPERPTLGKRASIWNLEYSLRRGIDEIATTGGIAHDPDDPSLISDPDQALAYLVATTIAEDVWEEAVGTRLTIANHFPRTQVARDTLARLTDVFVLSHFSLQKLLTEIVADPSFNLSSPDEDCGSKAYPLPRIFDPWTDRDSNPQARGNSVGDAVNARAPRPMLRSLHTTMGWPALPDFPLAQDGDFQAALGFFLSSSEPGFRGLGMEARLVWEDRYGRCDLAQPDYVSDLMARATGAGAPLREVVLALKDRLVNEPWIDASEIAPLESLLGAPLSTATSASHEASVRLVCGAYISSPQFLLGGLPAKDTRDIPSLTPEAENYDATCQATKLRLEGSGANWSIECSPGALSVRLN
jgi:hypothetical protein